MFRTSLNRLWTTSLCLAVVGVAASCSDTGGTPSATPGNGGAGPGAGGNDAQAGTPSAGGASSGAAGAASGGAAMGGQPTAGASGAAGATAGGAAGGGAGGSAGAGGSGGGATAFVPCNTEPAAAVPTLKRGAPITGFDGMDTAGQMVGVPGEPGLLYVIGHRDGHVFTVQDGQVVATPLVTVNVANGGNNEQGLLSMALHPNFATNHLFYLFYTADNEEMTIDEFERTSPTAATFKQNIYAEPRDGDCCFHNGGSITFNPKDAMPSLYFSVGNQQGNNAGDPEGTAGRVLRVDPVSKMYTTFAYGFRNPYRMSVDRLTGDMYIADVANGPGGTVIFNGFGTMGKDYLYRNNNGSPDVNEGVLRDSNGAAIIGGYVYRGNKIPGLCGRYFYGNHQGGTVKSIVVKNGAKVGDTVTHTELSVPGNITSFGEDGEGELYMASLNNDAIYKIEAE